MHRQMNHKTTIIEVIGHECSQRDRRVYSQRESRLAAFEGMAKGIREINAPFIYSCATLISIGFQMPVTQAIRHV